VHVFDP
jgi:serine/threonine protein kinase